MNKQEFLDNLHAERARWEALLAEIPETRLSEPGVGGEWTVKDVIAHVVWHEREMLGVLRQRALVGSDLWGMSTGERNMAIYKQNRDRPLPDVLAEARRVYPELLAELQQLDDADFVDPARFAEMPPDWQPWKVLASNTYEHYRDHREDLLTWLGPAGAGV